MDDMLLPWDVMMKVLETSLVMLKVSEIKSGALEWAHDMIKYLTTEELLD